jgi:DNA polymerase III subunit epsilon
MGELDQDIFICLDCETTGLDPKKDRIIEIAVAKFTTSEILESFQTLIDPECPISESSIAIHHITESMVVGQPKIQEVLPRIADLLDHHIIIGHGISLDLNFLAESAKRCQVPASFDKAPSIDTVRLARLYGESPTNSLETLREHFNIEPEGAHRAMSDVVVNISVFKYLTQTFKTTEQILERLKKPILLKAMPLGKYKGRPFHELSVEYLNWVAHADFDQDLLFSARTELQKRKKGDRFLEAANPFSQL